MMERIIDNNWKKHQLQQQLFEQRRALINQQSDNNADEGDSSSVNNVSKYDGCF